MSNEQWLTLHVSINTIAIAFLYMLKRRQIEKDDILRSHVEVALKLMNQNARLVCDDKQRTIEAVDSVRHDAKRAATAAAQQVKETAEDLKLEIPRKVVEELHANASEPGSGLRTVVTPQTNKIPPSTSGGETHAG